LSLLRRKHQRLKLRRPQPPRKSRRHLQLRVKRLLTKLLLLRLMRLPLRKLLSPEGLSR
jgi:hypothetical protein